MKCLAFGAAAALAFSASADVDPLSPAGYGAINWNDRAVRQRAVIETAYAYYLAF